MAVIGTPWVPTSDPGPLFPHGSLLSGGPPAGGLLLEATSQHRARIAAEIRPESYLGELLVEQVARSAAALDLAATAESGIIHLGQQQLPSLSSDSELQGSYRLARLANDALLRTARYRSGHVRDFCAAVRLLQDLQAGYPRNRSAPPFRQ